MAASDDNRYGLRVVDADPDAATHRALVPTGEASGADADAMTLANAIGGWLQENGYDLATGSRQTSRRTGWEYASDLASYRAACLREGLDLDSYQVRRLGLIAQKWAGEPKRLADGALRPVTPATHNRRLASVSSFYRYAIRYDLPDTGDPGDSDTNSDTNSETTPPRPPRPPMTVRNPIERAKRKKVTPYAGAQALDHDDLLTRLAAIDTTTLRGKRDYALLQVALNTGRRCAELQALTWGDVQMREGGKIARITWRHTKGDKEMRDDLDPAVTGDLLAWVYAAYGARIGSLASDKPLWLPFRRGEHLPPIGEERAMSHDAIREVYVARLGTGKVHASRHTFSEGMIKNGASVLVLQERLGHSNLETTGHYARSLTGATNPYAGKLASYFHPQGAPRRRAPVTHPLGKR